jgi:GxxExxY protein
MTQMAADENGEGETPERDRETYRIIGAAIEVHRHLGSGFLEAVYHEALAIELTRNSIPFDREVALAVRYKGRVLNCPYRADFVCYGSVVLELKALGQLSPREHSQLINYLKATGLMRGLLLNFGASRLEYKRVILSSHLRPSATSADNSSPEIL